MTRPRLQRKPPPPRQRLPWQRLILPAAIALALAAGVVKPRASPSDRLVVNPHTGLAISGFDPVAYFTQAQALPGLAGYELTENGAVWRFVNPGNRAAFAEHPQVYAPQFGGYDPVAIGRESSVPGHPQIWAVAGERLYLFYDEEARTAFLANPGRYIESASRKWPAVAATIGR